MAVVELYATFPGGMGQMIEAIVPRVLKARASLGAKAGSYRDALKAAYVWGNVLRVVDRVRTSEALLLEPVRMKKLIVVGARYDLDDSGVEFFES